MPKVTQLVSKRARIQARPASPSKGVRSAGCGVSEDEEGLVPAWLCMDLRPGCPCGQGLRPHAAWWAQHLTSCFPTALGIVCSSPATSASALPVHRAPSSHCWPFFSNRCGLQTRQGPLPFGSSSLGTPRYRAHPSRLGKQVSLTRMPYTPTPTRTPISSALLAKAKVLLLPSLNPDP